MAEVIDVVNMYHYMLSTRPRSALLVVLMRSFIKNSSIRINYPKGRIERLTVQNPRCI